MAMFSNFHVHLNSQAQAMKEQAQLREEMAYQYKIGNFEVSIVNLICPCCVISNNFESIYSLTSIIL